MGTFIGIMKSPNTWKIIALIIIAGIISAKLYSLSSTIDDLKDEGIKKDKTISDLQLELNSCKMVNFQNKKAILDFENIIEKQNSSIKEKEVINGNLTNIIEENKKNKPSVKIIREKTKSNDCTYTRFKGMKYEDL